MKRKAVTFFLIALFAASFSTYRAQENLPLEPTITIRAIPEIVSPGQEVTIRVTVLNDIGTYMWNTEVYIDKLMIPEELQDHVEIIVGNKGDLKLPSPMSTGDKETVELKIRITEQIPADELDVPIIVSTEEGICEGHGCIPFRTDPPKYAHIEILRTKPSVLLTLDIKSFLLQAEDCGIITTTLDVPFRIKNVGNTSVYNISFYLASEKLYFDYDVETPKNLNELRENEEVSGTFKLYLNEVGVNVYTIVIRATYYDRYNKKFTIEDQITIEVRNEAYSFYAKAEEYYNNCNYTKAEEYYTNAKNKYEEAGNTNMALKIERKIYAIRGNESFESAQQYYFSGEVTRAKEQYQQAKDYYDRAKYCIMADICQTALNSIEEGKTPPPTSPSNGETKKPSIGGDIGRLISTTNLIFYAIIVFLTLIIIYQRR